MSLDDVLIVIPARLQSQRLPRKPLADLAGKPLIVRVCENLAPLKSQGATIIVATDHQDIVAACRNEGIEVRMTSPEHQSGTDRIWEIAKQESYPLVVNVQGDEPFLALEDVQTLVRSMQANASIDIGTLAFSVDDDAVLRNPNAVKVVTNPHGKALYFSRAPIPFHRDGGNSAKQHVGIYGFRRASLERFCKLPPSTLEVIEKLEQLRALEAGMYIHVDPATRLTHGVDTEEDLIAARARF